MRSKIIYSADYVNKSTFDFSQIKNIFSFFKRNMKDSKVLFFIQSVCEFLNVNNDLGFCLESSIHCVSMEFQPVIRNIVLRLNQGESFSRALEVNNIFPSYAIKIIRAGEKNKSFKETFEMLKDFMQWNTEQKKRLRMALAYPAFTFFVFIGIIFLFANYIVPSIFNLLNSISNADVSNYKIFFMLISSLKYLAFSFVAAGIALFITYFTRRDVFEKIALRMPIFGEFLLYKAIYVTSYYLSSSIKNGVSILESFDIAIESSNGVTKSVLTKIKEDAIKGVKINESIRKFDFIPKIVSDLIKTGEDSGGLSNSLELVKQMFYSKYQMLMGKLINVLPVVLIVITSIMMIGFVIMVFMPLYSFG